jgi:hypothetical protein
VAEGEKTSLAKRSKCFKTLLSIVPVALQRFVQRAAPGPFLQFTPGTPQEGPDSFDNHFSRFRCPRAGDLKALLIQPDHKQFND